MTSLFPSLFAYPGISTLILRVASGMTLAWFGYRKLMGRGHSSGSNSKIYGATETFLSLFIVFGLFTQLAALINIVILVIKLSFKAQEKKLFSDGVNYYILLLAMLISLLFMGSGYLSIDGLL